MKLVGSREFRTNPGKVWQNLKKSERLIVTSNGKPMALLISLQDQDLEEALKNSSAFKAMKTLSTLRAHSRAAGLNKLPLKDIDEEIKKARKSQ